MSKMLGISANINKLFILLLFILNIHLTCSTPLASETLKGLLNYEPEVFQILEKYTSRGNFEKINRLIQERKEVRLNSVNLGISHPTDVYHFMKVWKEAVVDLADIKELADAYMDITALKIPYLDEIDVTAAASSILRLQRVYKLQVSDIVKGKIGARQGRPLTLDEAFMIGSIAYTDLEELDLAAEWFNYILEAKDPAYNITSTLARLADLHHEAGDIEEAVRHVRLATKEAPGKVRLGQLLKRYEKEMEQTDKVKKRSLKDWERPKANPDILMEKWQRNYEELCRGDSLRKETSPKMYCRYRFPGNPYLQTKEEILNRDPIWVSVFYDVINESMGKMIKDIAAPTIGESGVEGNFDSLNGRSFKDSIRVSKNTWIDESSRPELKAVSLRIALIIGLNTTFQENADFTAEQFQIVNYGVGGVYKAHLDNFNGNGGEDGDNDRLATFLLYLNDVEYGGATVFPELHLRVLPKKNSAVFWYSLDRALRSRSQSAHAGCPVLLGEKWVGNKWMWAYGQQLLRPCGLHENTLDDQDMYLESYNKTMYTLKTKYNMDFMHNQEFDEQEFADQAFYDQEFYERELDGESYNQQVFDGKAFEDQEFDGQAYNEQEFDGQAFDDQGYDEWPVEDW